MRNFWQLQHVAACVQEAVRVTKHPPPNKAKLIIMVAWQLWHIIFNILIQTQDQRIITSQVTGYFQDWTFGRYLNQRRDKADYVAFYPVAMCVIRCESSMKIPFFQTDRRGFSTVTSCSVVPITRSVRSPVYTRTNHTCASVRALIRTCKVRASQAPRPLLLQDLCRGKARWEVGGDARNVSKTKHCGGNLLPLHKSNYTRSDFVELLIFAAENVFFENRWPTSTACSARGQGPLSCNRSSLACQPTQDLCTVTATVDTQTEVRSCLSLFIKWLPLIQMPECIDKIIIPL